MYGESSAPPASSNKTLARGSAESRLARTQPAEPAPIIMKSNMISVETWNIQHPKSKLQRRSNIQALKPSTNEMRGFPIGYWVLDLLWSLDVGGWMFILTLRPP